MVGMVGVGARGSILLAGGMIQSTYHFCMRYLSLQDPEAVADYIESVIELVPERSRQEYEALQAKVLSGAALDPEELAQKIQTLGLLVWVPKRAVSLYTKTLEGAAEEWRKLDESLRPATSFLLSRIRRNTGAMTVEEAVLSGDGEYGLYEEQRDEIEALLAEIAIELWQEQQPKLTAQVKEAQEELDAIRKRLMVFKRSLERIEDKKEKEAAEAKLEAYEEQIFFLGEMVPLEVLDQELGVEL